MPNEEKITIQDGQNTYNLSNLASHSSGYEYQVEIDLVAGSSPTINSLTIEENTPGVIEGIVTDTNDDVVEGAWVEALKQADVSGEPLSSPEAYRVQTDSNGFYSISVPDGGEFHVTARYTTSQGDLANSRSKPFIQVSALPQITWETTSDWDSSVSESGVVHESFEDLAGSDVIQLGYPSFDRGGSSLKAYYPLDEANSTDSVTDVTGNGNDGTNQGGVTVGSTGLHNTTAFDYANSSYTELPNTLPEISIMTFAMWYYWEGNDSTDTRMLNMRDNYRMLVNIGRASSGELGVRWVGDTNPAKDIGFGVFPNSNQWNSLVIIYDGTNLIAYHNGTEEYNQAESTPDDPNNANHISQPDEPWDGLVDNVRVYTRALSTSEAQAFHNAGTSGSLETATKSFSQSKKPDLDSLSYSLNSQSISLDVIGSPGTASEEVVTQSLDGATSYSLTWSNSHTDFRIRPNLSTTDVTTSPTLSSVTLR